MTQIWQPIEIAPKDSTILVTDGWSYYVCSWNHKYKSWMYDWSEHLEVEKPTHWMPLPLLPES